MTSSFFLSSTRKLKKIIVVNQEIISVRIKLKQTTSQQITKSFFVKKFETYSIDYEKIKDIVSVLRRPKFSALGNEKNLSRKTKY